MIGRFLQPCSQWSANRVMLLAALLTAAIEGVTALLRFGLHLKASAETDVAAAYTNGFHLHHGFTGTLLILVAFPLWRWPAVRNLLLVLGIALLASDLIHHFLVLWPLTGQHEFELFYP